jgi:sarcosine oxidase
MMLLDEDEIGIYERDAGYLNPELCIQIHLQQAAQRSAELHFEEGMTSYRLLDSDREEEEEEEPLVEVTTTRGLCYRTRRLVLTVGAWAADIYGRDLSSSFTLKIERRVLFWFRPTDLTAHFKVLYLPGRPLCNRTLISSFHTLLQDIPVYIWDLGVGFNFYGFPERVGHEEEGVKVAFHQRPATLSTELARPEHMKTATGSCGEAAEEQQLREVLRRKMPALEGALVAAVPCMYTVTPDEHL